MMIQPSKLIGTCLAVSIVAFGVGCADASDSAAPVRDPVETIWSDIRRPLQIPRRAAGATCPVTAARRLSQAFAPAQGNGPLYPVGAAVALSFIYPVQPKQEWYPSDWSGNKIAWTARKGFRGRVLIRGRQVDGAHELRFGDGQLPAKEMRLTAAADDVGEDGWYQHGSTTRVRAPGCYAWQVDGTSFSYVIVFRAARVLP